MNRSGSFFLEACRVRAWHLRPLGALQRTLGRWWALHPWESRHPPLYLNSSCPPMGSQPAPCTCIPQGSASVLQCPPQPFWGVRPPRRGQGTSGPIRPGDSSSQSGEREPQGSGPIPPPAAPWGWLPRPFLAAPQVCSLPAAAAALRTLPGRAPQPQCVELWVKGQSPGTQPSCPPPGLPQLLAGGPEHLCLAGCRQGGPQGEGRAGPAP